MEKTQDYCTHLQNYKRPNEEYPRAEYLLRNHGTCYMTNKPCIARRLAKPHVGLDDYCTRLIFPQAALKRCPARNISEELAKKVMWEAAKVNMDDIREEMRRINEKIMSGA